jgi:hypothetical protein
MSGCTSRMSTEYQRSCNTFIYPESTWNKDGERQSVAQISYENPPPNNLPHKKNLSTPHHGPQIKIHTPAKQAAHHPAHYNHQDEDHYSKALDKPNKTQLYTQGLQSSSQFTIYKVYSDLRIPISLHFICGQPLVFSTAIPHLTPGRISPGQGWVFRER